jgi:hypothetical protein
MAPRSLGSTVWAILVPQWQRNTPIFWGPPSVWTNVAESTLARAGRGLTAKSWAAAWAAAPAVATVVVMSMGSWAAPPTNTPSLAVMGKKGCPSSRKP